MNKLILIDGNYFLYRSYYSHIDIQINNENKINAIYMFMNNILDIINNNKNEKIIVAFDLGHDINKKTLYDQYKENRQKMNDDLYQQMLEIKRILKLMNITLIEKQNIEADDIIGTIAKQYNGLVNIYTGDSDLMQLIDDNITLYYMTTKHRKYSIYNINNFYQLKGIYPHQIVDFKILSGDPSDNIKLFNGIGEKTAIKLLNMYNNIYNIYNYLDNLNNKIKNELISKKDQIEIFRKIISININVDIEYNINNCIVQLPFNDNVKSIFESFEFYGLIYKNKYCFYNKDN